MAETIFNLTTDKSVDEAVQAIGEALSQHELAVLWDLDLNEKLRAKGLEPETPFRILEVCSASRAKAALHQNPQVGYFLPCKIVVYQDPASKKTTVGYPKPEVLLGLVGDHHLDSLAQEVESLMQQAIRDAIGKK